jgi:hypothetical protein
MITCALIAAVNVRKEGRGACHRPEPAWPRPGQGLAARAAGSARMHRGLTAQTWSRSPGHGTADAAVRAARPTLSSPHRTDRCVSTPVGTLTGVDTSAMLMAGRALTGLDVAAAVHAPGRPFTSPLAYAGLTLTLVSGPAPTRP